MSSEDEAPKAAAKPAMSRFLRTGADSDSSDDSDSDSEDESEMSDDEKGRDTKAKSRFIHNSDSEDDDSDDDEIEVVDANVGFAYVGSHNFTPSAWGNLSGSAFNPIMNVR